MFKIICSPVVSIGDVWTIQMFSFSLQCYIVWVEGTLVEGNRPGCCKPGVRSRHLRETLLWTKVHFLPSWLVERDHVTATLPSDWWIVITWLPHWAPTWHLFSGSDLWTTLSAQNASPIRFLTVAPWLWETKDVTNSSQFAGVNILPKL